MANANVDANGMSKQDLEASDDARGFIKPQAQMRTMRSLAAIVTFGLVAVSLFFWWREIKISEPPEPPARMVMTNVVGPEVALSTILQDEAAAQRFRSALLTPKLHPSGYSKRDEDHKKTKSRVKFSGERLSNPGGCKGRGPQLLNPGSPAPADDAKLAPLSEVAASVAEHLREMSDSARLLSPEHETLCSWDPQPFVPSMPRYSSPAEGDAQDGSEDRVGSAFSFFDVCVSFNMNSGKQAQRGLVYVDPLNNDPERCVACPNPQTTYDWISNPCGIMWMHQVNVKSLKDYQPCYDANKRTLAKLGQEQAPGSRKDPRSGDLRAAVYYTRPVLILNYVGRNPGHQLWDTLFSLVPILMSQEAHGVRYFDYVISHETPLCEESIWLCNILRRLGLIRPLDEDPSRTNLLPFFKHVLPCFSHAIVPISGWNHENRFSSRKMLSWLQERMRQSFELELPARNPDATSRMLRNVLGALSHKQEVQEPGERYTLTVYSHHTIGEAGQRRAWLDIDVFSAAVAERLPFVDVTDVRDFAQLSIEGQARTFHEADIIVMPHGGQFGNSIFVRPETIVIEITCGSYSNLGTGGTFAPAAGFHHLIQMPCHCTSRTDYGNFDYALDRAVEQHEAEDVEEEPRPIIPPGVATSSLPRDWATARPKSRRSLSHRSQSSRRSDVSPTRSVASIASLASKASKASKADFEDVYDNEAENEVAVELNPDEEHQLDADDNDFDRFNLPRPGQKTSSVRSRARSKVLSPSMSRRLSTGINKLVGVRSSTSGKSIRDRNMTAVSQRVAAHGPEAAPTPATKRLSFRRSIDPERQAQREAQRAERRESKARAKATRSYEKKRARDIKTNPWYPAGVDFRYLSPKSTWIPYLGRDEENDFGDESRLFGVAL
ncbi:Hypothetical Protein FCC1311_028062 [Hondaea fermentalgiana]|uniref:Glycosyltransferase 61 catalytic domain-containing protein n=1 Tax=Hondaea fermentalgiana TaxID=2315210 RepID=A0A2R5G7R4_9STRA|nr:Hypothetical Protein FCC1311_028062 [Hondaea fermentalgiana]|eukprot:GBG26585.1 Hypothetical Protein FCC1311_028062 [Hondaea fermentalgiana]